MTDTLDSSTAASADAPASAKKRGGGLNSLLLADLKAMAGGLGISGSGSMKKAQLVDAIKAAQSGGGPSSDQSSGRPSDRPSDQSGGRSARSDRPSDGDGDRAAPAQREATAEEPAAPASASDTPPAQERPAHQPPQVRQRTRQRSEQPRQGQADKAEPETDRPEKDRRETAASETAAQARDEKSREDRPADQSAREPRERRQDRSDQARGDQQRNEQPRGDRNDQARNDQARNDQARGEQDGERLDENGERSTRNRRRRGRDRDRPLATSGSAPAAQQQPRNQREPDTTILEDDVLVPAAGILDVLDNYAFVRTSGYLPGNDDVYLSLSMVRKLGLRRGDAIVGQVRQPREGERKEKFNPMVRIDAVNGLDPELARTRVEFAKLTPLYPSERLRLETDPTNMIGRIIDIAAPIGKGQRGLIVSPAKAGKTMVLQSIANSITSNNPECHLMVVLVDERPEEVTDFERSVKGEVIASTFDRPALDHTIVAELAIERAKRLVELGHDVVVLLDGITRLGRAYNLSAPASGRILSGGVDSAALYPPKKFFGAARNIENGGSLTILATALIESGSKMDEVIFEEFKGTGNMEVRLRRDFADKRIFPSIDVIQSGTRREELLLSSEEMAIIWKLRRVISSLDGQQALELLLERLKKTSTNIEFLMSVQKTTPAEGE
ncbi:MAG: transcription termination factor Rho [Actinobacteria bacterium]|uniref:Unannotated protein n=1 Tax=freshwater metagenome TaxID=449393 RepID=A0A6J6QAW0_9ZZZZ|nr:transcription termination factor Rho [Actinomycetota bacterium]